MPPEIAHPGDQDVVALPDQRGHVAQVDFQRQAGLVDGQGCTPVQNIPVGGGADRHLDAQLLEKGAPEGIITVIQQGPGQADGYGLFFHVGNPLCCWDGRQGRRETKKRGTPTACLSQLAWCGKTAIRNLMRQPPAGRPHREPSAAGLGWKRRNSHQSIVFGEAGNGTVVGISELVRMTGLEPVRPWATSTSS